MIYRVFNEQFEEIINAKHKWEAEAEFISMHYPTKLDDDLPNLEIEVEVKHNKNHQWISDEYKTYGCSCMDLAPSI